MGVKKYYAVKNGREPGIYRTWDACKQQIHGYPGALYKSFPTEMEAHQYINGIEKENSTLDTSEDSYDIYVDGSFSNNVYSWGFAVFHLGELIHTANGIGEDQEAISTRNVAGELEATMNAVKWAAMNDLKHIVIHHDYIGISEWAENRWRTNNQVTKNYAEFMKSYQNLVDFKKVTGHTGVIGNELADKLAKEALGIKK